MIHQQLLILSLMFIIGIAYLSSREVVKNKLQSDTCNFFQGSLAEVLSTIVDLCKAAVPVRWKTCEHCDHVFRSKRKAECNLREKAMKRMRAVVSDSVKSARLKISCTKPVKERQKSVSELCIGRRMASMNK